MKIHVGNVLPGRIIQFKLEWSGIEEDVWCFFVDWLSEPSWTLGLERNEKIGGMDALMDKGNAFYWESKLHYYSYYYYMWVTDVMLLLLLLLVSIMVVDGTQRERDGRTRPTPAWLHACIHMCACSEWEKFSLSSLLHNTMDGNYFGFISLFFFLALMFPQYETILRVFPN